MTDRPSKRNVFQTPKPRSLPWQKQQPAIDSAVDKLTSTLHRKKTTGNRTPLSAKETQSLKQQFKHAEQARSSALRHMVQISKAIGSKSPESSTKLAPMKAWETAADKFAQAGRSTNDLGRGRVILDDVEAYYAFLSLMSAKDKDGHLQLPGAQKIRIIGGSFNNYIDTPRKSGYAGSINFDLSIEQSKGREGRFEVQVIPEAYLKVYDQSHRLYDLIRIYDEIPQDYLSDEDRLIRDVLTLCNKALFAEHSVRAGFDEVTSFRGLKVTQGDLPIINNILDKVRDSVEVLPGRNFKWKQETLDAITYAKTSVMNIFLSQTPRVQSSKPILGQG